MSVVKPKHISILGNTLRVNALATDLVLQKTIGPDPALCIGSKLIKQWASSLLFLTDGGLTISDSGCLLTNGVELPLVANGVNAIVTWQLDDNGLSRRSTRGQSDLLLRATELLFTTYAPATNWLSHFLPDASITHMRLGISPNKSDPSGDSREFIFSDNGLELGLSILINQVRAGNITIGRIDEGFLDFKFPLGSTKHRYTYEAVSLAVVKEVVNSDKPFEKEPGKELTMWELWWNSSVEQYNQFKYW